MSWAIQMLTRSELCVHRNVYIKQSDSLVLIQM